MMATLWYRQRCNGELETEIEMLRRQNSDLVVLRADNRRLMGEAPARAEATRKKQEELARLQTQITAWQKQIETLKQRRDQEKQRTLQPPPPEPPMEPLPGMMARNTLQNVGRDTPSHLFQTRLWAIGHSDWQTLADMYAWPPEALTDFNAAFSRLAPEEQARVGSPERMAVMSIFQASDSSPSPSPFAGRPVGVTENVVGPDDVDLVFRQQISPDKIRDAPPQRVHRFPDGWKFVWPAASSEEKKAMFDATPPTQRGMRGKN
jgi:hypothetical protein